MLKYDLNEPESFEEIKVQEYINKYIKELQRHFDISNIKIRRILLKVYKDLGPFNQIKREVDIYIKKSKAMIKSRMEKIFKKGN